MKNAVRPFGAEIRAYVKAQCQRNLSPIWSIMDDLGRYVLDYTGKWRL